MPKDSCTSAFHKNIRYIVVEMGQWSKLGHFKLFSYFSLPCHLQKEVSSYKIFART